MMSDAVQVVIVTVAAALALAVLLRPLFTRDRPGPSKPAGNCDSCGAEQRRDRS